jgi:hypothetical protein
MRSLRYRLAVTKEIHKLSENTNISIQPKATNANSKIKMADCQQTHSGGRPNAQPNKEDPIRVK